MSSECLCDRCSALCCRYFALQIDTPTSPSEFDDIRWYLAHENVHVFVEESLWYLAVQTRCQYLQADHRCGIYEDRPRICREYSTENCDYHVGEYEFEHYFTTPEQLEAFAQALLGPKQKAYALRQRTRNTGAAKLPKGHPQRPRGKEVLHARIRPRIKGHPSLHPPHVLHPPAGAAATAPGGSPGSPAAGRAALVQLSLPTKKR